MDFVPPQVSDEILLEFKKEFGHWVTANGFRELVQSFELFLDKVYDAALGIDINTRGIETNLARKRLKGFHQEGISKKLDHLSSEYAIATIKEPALDSINLMRNCLTHRRGIVAPKDGDPALEVHWWGFDIALETKEGVRTILPHVIGSEGLFVANESQALALYVERSKSFPIGTVVQLSSRDVAEMCQMMLMAAQDILKSFLAYSDSKGIAHIPMPSESSTWLRRS
jgi:hypothetical protein